MRYRSWSPDGQWIKYRDLRAGWTLISPGGKTQRSWMMEGFDQPGWIREMLPW